MDISKKETDRRVVITGMGLVTPAGLTLKDNWKKIISGQTAIKRITPGDGSSMVKLGGEVKDFVPEKYVKNRKSLRFLRRDVLYALASAQFACEDSKLELSTIDPSRVGLYVGSGETQVQYDSFFSSLEPALDENGHLDFRKWGSLGLPRIYPNFVLLDLYNDGFCYLSIENGITGINNNFTAGPSSGHAIGEAFKAVQRGDVDIAIAGGHDSLLSFENFFLYSATGLLTRQEDPHKAMKPYSASRDGFVVGEGAGFIVLEHLKNALARNAPIRGEIVGYSCNCDTNCDLLDPDPNGEGLSYAIDAALRDAKIVPGQVGYINSEGKATLKNDLSETRAFKKAFGKKAYDTPISSIKPVIGHSGAASSAIELIITALALERGIVPPTINCISGDPECDLDYVPYNYRVKEMEHVISVNKGLGGQNCVFVLKEYSSLRRRCSMHFR